MFFSQIRSHSLSKKTGALDQAAGTQTRIPTTLWSHDIKQIDTLLNNTKLSEAQPNLNAQNSTYLNDNRTTDQNDTQQSNKSLNVTQQNDTQQNNTEQNDTHQVDIYHNDTQQNDCYQEDIFRMTLIRMIFRMTLQQMTTIRLIQYKNCTIWQKQSIEHFLCATMKGILVNVVQLNVVAPTF